MRTILFLQFRSDNQLGSSKNATTLTLAVSSATKNPAITARDDALSWPISFPGVACRMANVFVGAIVSLIQATRGPDHILRYLVRNWSNTDYGLS